MMITPVYPALCPSVPSDFSGRGTSVSVSETETEKVTEKQRQTDGDKALRYLGGKPWGQGSYCGLHNS